MPRKTKAPRRKRAGRPRRRAMKPRLETARIQETYDFPDPNMNAAYVDYQLSLARFTRASLVARGFQLYRITKVTYKFKPKLDTFAVNATQGTPPAVTTIPYLYTVIDKIGNLSDFTTADELRQAGAKPKRLDDKTLSVSYKPAVLQYTLDRNNATNTWAKPLVSPWLSTDKYNDVMSGGANYLPSSIDHLGLAWIVEQTGTAAGVVNTYGLEVTVDFEFKKPSMFRTVGAEAGAPAIQIGSDVKDVSGNLVV